MKQLWPWIEKPRQRFVIGLLLILALLCNGIINILHNNLVLGAVCIVIGGLMIGPTVDNFKKWKNK